MPATSPCVPCSTVPQNVAIPGVAGLSAYAAVTNPFTIPAVAANVNVSVNQSSSFVEGQNVFVGLSSATGANFSVYSVNSPTSITLTYLGFAGDLVVGAVVPVGYLVVPGTGNVAALTTLGFTKTTSPFNIASSVTISVGSSAAFAVDQQVFIANATQRINAVVTAVPSSNSLTVMALGFPSDTASGTIGSGALVTSGSGNDSSFGSATTLSAPFAIPAANSSGSAAVFGLNVTGGIGPKYVVIYSPTGGTLYGTFSVSASSSTGLTLTPLLLPGDSQSGTFPAGSIVLPVGAVSASGFGPGITGDVSGTQMAKYLSANAGSGYAITTSPANITIGAVPLQITLPLAGTYLLFGWVNINCVGATFPVTGSGVSNIAFVFVGSFASSFANTLIVRPRVGASTAFTTQSGTLETPTMPPATVIVTGPTFVNLQVVIDTAPTAGSVEVIAAELFAVKIA